MSKNTAEKAVSDPTQPHRPQNVAETGHVIQIPYLLSFVPGQPELVVAGRGEAGWTLKNCGSEDAARAFLAVLPRMSWMPGTYRAAADLGVW